MNDDFRPLRPRPSVTPVPQRQKPTHTTNDISFKLPPPSAEAPPRPTFTHPGKPHKKGGLLHKLRHLSRKQIIIISVVLGLIVAGALIWWFAIRKKPEAPKPTPPPAAKVEEAPPQPTTVASRLTGVQIPPEENNLPVTGVMIENSPDARPQSGLFSAGVVYEAIAEGGITRFLTLFMEAKPDYIGPVRSVRPYYLDFLVPYDAPIAHAGGSGQALAEIRAQGIKDFDHGANASTFWRVNTRFAPHNLYTSREKLLQLHNAKGVNTSSFNGFARKADKPSATPNARSIDLTISSPLYNPHFEYDAPTNSYLRSEGGKPHMDERAGKQINPKVIVAIVTSHSYAGIYSVYGTTGSGKAYFFQDGAITEGVWEKKDRKSQYKFGDANGSPQGLNAGQTWVTMITSPSAIKHQ